MKKSKVVKILEKVAVERGVSVAEVRRDMQESLDYAYNNSDDEFWTKWKEKGRKPTLDEFIISLSRVVQRNIKLRKG